MAPFCERRIGLARTRSRAPQERIPFGARMLQQRPVVAIVLDRPSQPLLLLGPTGVANVWKHRTDARRVDIGRQLVLLERVPPHIKHLRLDRQLPRDPEVIAPARKQRRVVVLIREIRQQRVVADCPTLRTAIEMLDRVPVEGSPANDLALLQVRKSFDDVGRQRRQLHALGQSLDQFAPAAGERMNRVRIPIEKKQVQSRS
jgi:hypothetical protein